METTDTIKLLQECDAGAKMTVSSIDDVLEKAETSELKHILQASKNHHEMLGNEIHSLLDRHGSEEKDPLPIARSMSWLKTNLKTSLNDSDAAVADLIVDGCNMGIKSLHKYQNQYKMAETESKNLCGRLIGIEEALREELTRYL